MPFYRILPNDEAQNALAPKAWETALRVAKEAADELSLPAPKIAWFADAPSERATSARVFWSGWPLLGQFRGKYPNEIWVKIRENLAGADGLVRTIAHEVTHYAQWASGQFELFNRAEDGESEAEDFEAGFAEKFFGQKEPPYPSMASHADAGCAAGLTGCRGLGA